MPAVTRANRALVLLVTAVIAAQAAPAAYADRTSSKGDSVYANGKTKGKNLTAETRIRVSVSGSSSPSSPKKGGLSSSDVNWTPPACWYEPAFSPKQIKSLTEAISSVPFLNFFGAMLKARYDGGEYKNYNLDKQGKGMFWAAVVNPKRKDDPKANSCDKPPFWVDENDTPDEPLAVSPKVLAEYAYDELPVPDTDITMSPDGKQTVNLDTWVWLNKAKFKPVSVTASLPNTNLSATTTATPVALTLEPGTAEAELHPSSGECPINKDGSIGTPYSADKKNQTPPCGITYLRSTNNTGPHHLKATLTWNISWTSTNAQGGDLPDGAFGTTTDVTVQEVQAINR
ncbi:hypothetical protein ABZS86_09330 [Streptomyces sp. NPDC005355]|uniref:hypothetical protein n=1 Tax=Streptomyces sp. NPDC005355 TaxID=3157038 RepID=UPI0033A4AE4E